MHATMIGQNFTILYNTSDSTGIKRKLIGGTELENCFAYNVHIFEAFCLTLVKKNHQNGECRKKSGYL